MNPTGKNGYRPWTEAELELLRRWYPYEGYRGVQVGRSASSIHHKAKKLGIHPPNDWQRRRDYCWMKDMERDELGRFLNKNEDACNIAPDEVQRRAMAIRRAKGGA